jgi:hypothetical protein
MVSSGVLHHVALVRTLQALHGITSQKTPFFIVTAVKTSYLTQMIQFKLNTFNRDRGKGEII